MVFCLLFHFDLKLYTNKYSTFNLLPNLLKITNSLKVRLTGLKYNIS